MQITTLRVWIATVFGGFFSSSFAFYEDLSISAYETKFGAIPYVSRHIDNTNIDYARAIVVGDKPIRVNQCNTRECNATSLLVEPGEILMVTASDSLGAFITSALSETLKKRLNVSKDELILELARNANNWERIQARHRVPQLQVLLFPKNSNKSLLRYIPQQAVKLLSEEEYLRAMAARAPAHDRKADAVKNSSLYLIPGTTISTTKFSIGANNQFGGSSNLSVTNISSDGHWYRVKYWVGELDGYAVGWVPKSALKIHPTNEELVAQEIARKDELEKLNDARREAEIREEIAEKERLERIAKERLHAAEIKAKTRVIVSQKASSLYEEDDTFSKVLMSLPKGTKVEFISENGFLHKVKYNQTTGYLDPISIDKVQ